MTIVATQAERQVRRALNLVTTLRAFAQLERGETPDKSLYVARLGCWLQWRAGFCINSADPIAEDPQSETWNAIEWDIKNPLGFEPGDDLSSAIRAMCLGNAGFQFEEICEHKTHAYEDLPKYGVGVHLHSKTIERFWLQYDRCRRARGY